MSFSCACVMALLSLAASIGVSAVNITSSEVTTLLQVLNALDANSSQLLPWSARNTDCADWVGVTCNSAGRVTELVIATSDFSTLGGLVFNATVDPSKGQFDGELSPALGNLTSLEILVLNDFVNVSGSIPPELGDLANLNTLVISSIPSLEGTIPPELGNLTNLNTLVISSTPSLEGTIPPELGNLANLNTLIISFIPGLSGPIPLELSKLSRLQTLILSETFLDGSIPPELGNLINLNTLNLTKAGNLSGTIPTELSKLVKLNTLVLDTIGAVNGEIPSELGVLVNLTTLNLAGNVLSGPIPESIGNLINLKELRLDANQNLTDKSELIRALDGPLPASLGNLVNLKVLNLFQNNFSGNPSVISKFQLTYLNLDDNSFSGNLSSFLVNKPALEELYLGSNDFSGPLDPIIGNLTTLRSLSLTDNKFTGPVPSIIGNLTELEYLVLSGNQFTSLPDELANLVKLNYLDVNVNPLSGNFPAAIASLTNLTSLSMVQNSLSGPFNISNLKKLRLLDLSLNQLGEGGGFPDYLATFTSLDTLVLDFNLLGGSIPPFIGNLKKLLLLSCTSCGLTGTVPESLSTLPVIQQIAFSGNALRGDITSFLCNATSATIIDFSSNLLNGSIPDCISNIQTLDSLYLNNNTFTGSIPSSFSEIPYLFYLSLSQNFLTGSIPSLRLENLYTLDLSSNNLQGQIPPGLGSLISLTVLRLKENRFVGSIPATFANLTNLEELDLSFCGLGGSIPSSLSALTKLTSLDLSFNSFTGSLSYNFFSKMTKLTYLSISGSTLTGRIPDLSRLTALANLDLSYNQFSYNFSSLPTQLVTLNLTSNFLSNELALDSFNSQKSLKFIQLDANPLTGSVPSVSATVLSLANTQVNGSIPNRYFTSNATSLVLTASPICETTNDTIIARFCNTTTLADLKVYKAEPVCVPATSCGQDNAPNPYIFRTNETCTCSGYFQLNSIITRAPFSILNAGIAKQIEGFFFSGLSLNPYQVQLSSAKVQQDNSISVVIRFFGVDEKPLNSTAIGQFNLLWPKSINGPPYPYLVTADIGRFLGPPVTSVIELYIPPPPPPPTPTSSSSSGLKTWIIIVIAALAALSLLAICLLLFLLLRGGDKSKSEFHLMIQEHFVNLIPLKDILAATDRFSEANVLGAGGYGTVYRGVNASGTIWAVKRAKSVSKKSLADFENEVDILSKVSHTNVVKLLGYCDEKNEQILVYEFMGKGTLRGLLQYDADDTTKNSLTLAERVNVALGAAEGLRYLHNFAEKTIIHRDVKSDNILLNDALQGKIADFGLLKDNPENSAEFLNTRVAGTTGYIDPEYYNNFKVNRKSDVYSFGVVLFEIITGLAALIKDDTVTDPDEPNITSLANWVQPYLDDYKKMVDPRLGNDYNEEAMMKLVKLAKSCTERFGKYRPLMDEVCYRLTQVKNIIEGKIDETIGEELENTSSLSHSAPIPFSTLSTSASQSNVIAPVSSVFSGR